MVELLLEMMADPDLEDDEGFTAMAAATWHCAADDAGKMVRRLLVARANLDAGRTSPLSLAMEREDYECSQLLLEAGASKEKALMGRNDADDAENIFFVGHRNTEHERRSVGALVEAHNAGARWLSWYALGRSLSVAHHVVLPPELAPAQSTVHAWRGSVDHCTHGVLISNSGRAAREISHDFLRSHSRQHGLQLTVHHLDKELSDRLRLLPGDPGPPRERSRSPRQ